MIIYNIMTNKNKIIKSANTWITASSQKINTEDNNFCNTRVIFQIQLDKLLNELISSGTKEEYAYIIYAILGEIGNNSFDHNIGNWPDIMGIFFAHDIQNKIIILADRGQGILKTLKKVKPNLKTHTQALKVAFTEKISGRAPEKRGNGLKFTKVNIKNTKMHLTFITGNAEAKLNDKMEIKKIKKIINGCLAILEI